jgi:peroxiredoxin Q/BCP
MEKITVGSNVPSFTLKDQQGESFSIDSVLGKKKLVIYFYPKDESAGCTRQACLFRDRFDVFAEAGALIIGISAQSVKSHAEFVRHHRLKFTLLSDPGNKVRKLFGVPGDIFGLVPGRVTYVINLDGKVVYTFNSQSRVEKHVEESLRILREI